MKLARELLFPLIAVALRLPRWRRGRPAHRRQPGGDLPAADRQRVLVAGRDRLHALLRDAADLHRPRRGRGVSLRSAEHRRRGPAVRRRVRDRLGRDQVWRRRDSRIRRRRQPADCESSRCPAVAPVLPRGHCRRRDLGRHSGSAQGAVRLARSHQHDHVELHRGRPGRVLHAIPLPDSGRPDHGERADQRRRAHRAAWPLRSRPAGANPRQPGVCAGDPRVLARLRPPVEDEMGLRDPRNGPESRGGGIRRRLGSQADRAGDGDFRRAGGHGRHQRGARLSLSLLRRFFGQLRLHRHRGRACWDAIIRWASSSPRCSSRCSSAAACRSTRSRSWCRRTSCRFSRRWSSCLSPRKPCFAGRSTGLVEGAQQPAAGTV